MNSKRPGKGASPTTVTHPKFCRVISRQQRLHTGGLAWNRIPPVAGTDWYATSPTELSGIVFSRRYMQDPHAGPRLRCRTASACPVCSRHTQHTRHGHHVPEIYLQRCCKIPAMFPAVMGLGHGRANMYTKLQYARSEGADTY